MRAPAQSHGLPRPKSGAASTAEYPTGRLSARPTSFSRRTRRQAGRIRTSDASALPIVAVSSAARRRLERARLPLRTHRLRDRARTPQRALATRRSPTRPRGKARGFCAVGERAPIGARENPAGRIGRASCRCARVSSSAVPRGPVGSPRRVSKRCRLFVPVRKDFSFMEALQCMQRRSMSKLRLSNSAHGRHRLRRVLSAFASWSQPCTARASECSAKTPSRARM